VGNLKKSLFLIIRDTSYVSLEQFFLNFYPLTLLSSFHTYLKLTVQHQVAANNFVTNGAIAHMCTNYQCNTTYVLK